MFGVQLGTAFLLFAANSALAGGVQHHVARQIQASNASTSHSLDITNCPGYTLSALRETSNGLTASLALAGPACNAFGQDITNLTIQVTYETQSRLHVHIFDTANSQFTVPDTVFARPNVTHGTSSRNSDLVFNHQSSPFAFWITRRSAPDDAPLFDTRLASLPPTPIKPVMPADNSTVLDSFSLVFEDQYLQLASALPFGANIYGLGEVVASSGIRRDIGTGGGVGTIQNDWARDITDPFDQNIYGVHPIYLEHRFNTSTNRSQSHGVFLVSANGADILLLTPPSSNVSLIEYRLIGGTLDFYFLSGPTPLSVAEQYAEIVGTPTWQPYWGFGFHLCRWGYENIGVVKDVVAKMRSENIPLETMWNDIDLYHALRDFTSDPASFPPDEMREFIAQLASNKQHFIPIVDAAIAKEVNRTDVYDPYRRGAELDVFMKNPDGSEYVGQVWPGYTVFPDWFAPNTTSWWTEGLRNWSQLGIEFSGIWLDMNEASSFCDGSCGSGIDISNTSLPVLLPGDPGNLITEYPEGYNATISGPSGNLTINGTLTFGATADDASSLAKRGIGAGNQTGIEINAPPYAIHNGNGPLSIHTLATNATHFGGYADLDTHNLWGLMETIATHKALQTVLPGKRPFIIARSTFASSGKWGGHWLGDNFSLWEYMHASIQGVLQFQLFGIPFVGADTCGFINNSDEELCNRWMQLAAFTPFYRNHNQRGAISQEPYVWDSVAEASRKAIAVRYSMLPYWYTLFANTSMRGTPPLRPLFWEFPNEPELFAVDRQFLIGRDILVTPVLTPNVSTVDGIFPGRGKTIWRDWYTHAVVDAKVGVNTTLTAPLGHINVHLRDGAAILLHQAPAYTVEETRAGPFELLVSLTADGGAFGNAYLDDGVSDPPGPSTNVAFHATEGALRIQSRGTFEAAQKLTSVTVLGVMKKPVRVEVGGRGVTSFVYEGETQEVVVSGLAVDLNEDTLITWK